MMRMAFLVYRKGKLAQRPIEKRRRRGRERYPEAAKIRANASSPKKAMKIFWRRGFYKKGSSPDSLILFFSRSL
ncbi:MAG: hypothetical protein HQK82_14960 [Desulfovibrionaceae bacterium]|nr:hypothetical protein [Desulfovibrionaceae bacterium]